jgi:hypothetical protein
MESRATISRRSNATLIDQIVVDSTPNACNVGLVAFYSRAIILNGMVKSTASVMLVGLQRPSIRLPLASGARLPDRLLWDHLPCLTDILPQVAILIHGPQDLDRAWARDRDFALGHDSPPAVVDVSRRDEPPSS